MSRPRLRTAETIDHSKAATWYFNGTDARIVRIQLRSSVARAYRWPDTPLPNAQPGLILFDDDNPPDLPTVRELLPEHDDLWNQLRHDRLDHLTGIERLYSGGER